MDDLIVIYRNKKNGNLYRVVREVIDATNARDGQTIVLYVRHTGEEETPENLLKAQMFAREAGEFQEKFEIHVPPSPLYTQ